MPRPTEATGGGREAPNLRRSGFVLAALSAGALALPWAGIIGAAIFLPPHADSLRSAAVYLWLPYVALAGVAIGFAIAPTHLTSLLAGFFFGVAAGIPAALCAIAIGTIIGHAFARRLAKDRLREILDRSRWGKVLARHFIDSGGLRSLAAVALARIPPQVPFAVGNLLGASARVPLPPMVAGTVAGMSPRAAMAVWVGAELVAWVPGQKLPAGLIWSLVAAVVGFGGLAIWSSSLLRKESREG